jgi:hypothetical protein
MGARRSGSPRQPRPVKTGWDWRPPRKPQPSRKPKASR